MALFANVVLSIAFHASYLIPTTKVMVFNISYLFFNLATFLVIPSAGWGIDSRFDAKVMA